MGECWHHTPSARLTALRVKKSLSRLDCDINQHGGLGGGMLPPATHYTLARPACSSGGVGGVQGVPRQQFSTDDTDPVKHSLIHNSHQSY